MQDDYLCALALLKMSYDQYGTTYLDYLAPFIGDTIRSMAHDQVAAGDLRKSLKIEYGLDIPEGVLVTLMRRLAKRGLGKFKDRRFHPDLSGLAAAFDFDSQRRHIDEQLTTLSDSFRRYVALEFDHQLSQSQASAMLIQYADENGLPMIQHAHGQQRLALSLHPNAIEYMTSRFIIHAFEGELPEMETLLILAKGSKLASVLYLPNPEDTHRRIRHLMAVLDTPTLLSAFGYQGERQEAAAKQMLALARKCNLNLSILEDTRNEVESVLHAVAHKIARHGYGERAVRGVDEYFLAQGYDASDIQLEIGRLDKALAELGVQKVARPDLTVSLSVDEVKLEARLQEGVGYQRSDSRLHDLNALTATYRLREGRMPTTFESCRAVFVTRNTSLARASREFFEEEYGRCWPIAITEDDLTTLLWLRQSLASPDLPRQRLLADAYAALEPGAVWLRFLDEIDKLHAEGELSDDDYVYFRYSLDAKTALMQETLGETDRMTADVVHEVVERARNQHRDAIREEVFEVANQSLELAEERERELESQLERAQGQRDDALESMREARAESAALLESQRTLARKRARGRARLVRLVLMCVASAVLVVGLWISAPPDWIWQPGEIPTLPRWVVGGSVAALFLVSAGNLVFGSYLSRSCKKIEDWIRQRLEERYLRGVDVSSREL